MTTQTPPIFVLYKNSSAGDEIVFTVDWTTWLSTQGSALASSSWAMAGGLVDAGSSFDVPTSTTTITVDASAATESRKAWVIVNVITDDEGQTKLWPVHIRVDDLDTN